MGIYFRPVRKKFRQEWLMTRQHQDSEGGHNFQSRTEMQILEPAKEYKEYK